MCPFPLNRGVPSIEVVDTKTVGVFPGTKFCVPRMEVFREYWCPKGPGRGLLP